MDDIYMKNIITRQIFIDYKSPKELKRFAITDNKIFDYGERDMLHEERHLDDKSIIEFISKWD